MAQCIVRTSKKRAAERQIHAAIAHFHSGDFECAIPLCSAAENQIPEPEQVIHLFGLLRKHDAKNSAIDGRKDDFNYAATWIKHGNGAEQVEIEEWQVKGWLTRAISKFRATYGSGTLEMIELFPWAGPDTGQS